MIGDIKRKNRLIDFFCEKENDARVIKEGKRFVNKRRILESVLENIPRLPLFVYKILAKTI